jgi:GGDEF domain-containing protein
METPLDVHGISLSYSFSYGISKYPSDGTELDQLSRIADSNMYIYKKIGGTPTE